MERVPKAPIPTDFIYGHESRFAGKMDRFIKAGPDNLHIVFDFDRTLTIGRGTEDVTTWHVLKNHLPQEGQSRYQELFEENRVHELNGTMDEVRAAAWWSNILDLFVEHKVNINEVERDFLGKASIRPNAIIIGDSLNDADMASGTENVMCIRVYDPREDEAAERDAVRTRTFEQFDTIIETGNLSVVLQLVQRVAGVTDYSH